MERIIVTVTEQGETQIKVEGCAGPGCKNLTKAIEQAIGQTTRDVATAEMHAPTHQGQQARTGAS